MLGYSNSGKTSFESAFLKECLNKDLNGLTIEGGDSVIQHFYKINHLYEEGEFPLPTDTNDYVVLSLRLLKKSQKILDFDFIDYGGGVLEDISQHLESPLTNEKLEEIKCSILVSEVVLVFIDSIELKRKTDDTAQTAIGFLPITQILKKSAEEAKKVNKAVNVIFVLTKTDSSFIEAWEIPSLKDRVKKMFSSSIEGNNNIHLGGVIDIAIIGQGRVITKVKGERLINIIKSEYKKNYEPKNIVSVFAMAVLAGMDNFDYNVEELSKLLKRKAKKFAGVKGFLFRIMDWFMSKGQEQIEKKEISRQLKESRKQLELIQSYKKELSSLIKEGK